MSMDRAVYQGVRRSLAQGKSECAALRARLETAEAMLAEQSRLIGELRIRLAAVEAVPAVKVHL